MEAKGFDKSSNGIHSYEDLVVFSSSLNEDEINELALKLYPTIRDFEELHYLISHLKRETIESISLARADLLTGHTDIEFLREFVGSDVYRTLQEVKGSRGA